MISWKQSIVTLEPLIYEYYREWRMSEQRNMCPSIMNFNGSEMSLKLEEHLGKLKKDITAPPDNIILIPYL